MYNIIVFGGDILFFNIVIELIIPGAYLIFVILFKKNWLDKKYDAKKSTFIADVLNALVILYFVFISDWIMAMLFIFIFARKLYPSKKIKK